VSKNILSFFEKNNKYTTNFQFYMVFMMNNTFKNYLLATSCLVVSLAWSSPSRAMGGKEEVAPAATSTSVKPQAASSSDPSSIAASVQEIFDIKQWNRSFMASPAEQLQVLETTARAGTPEAQERLYDLSTKDFLGTRHVTPELGEEILALGWAQKHPWVEECIAKMLKSSDKKIQEKAHLFLYNRDDDSHESTAYLDEEYQFKKINVQFFIADWEGRNNKEKKLVNCDLKWLFKELHYVRHLLEINKSLPATNTKPVRALKQTCLTIAAEKGNLSAMYLLGRLLCESKKKREGIYWLRKAAENGHVRAMDSLRFFLVQGSTKEEIKEAIHWFREGAKNGDVGAKASLVGLDGSEEAVQWATEEAQAGFVPAMLNLGRHYMWGSNDRKAIEWYEKAADKGEPRAFTRLGHCYLTKGNGSEGQKKFLEKAHFYFEKAAELGDPNAAVFLQQIALTAEEETQEQDDALAQALEASLCPTTSMSAGHREEKQDESASSPATSSASLASTSATSSASLSSASISSSASLASSEQVASSDSDDDSDEDPKATATFEQAPEEVAVVDPATSIKNPKYLRARLKDAKQAYETAVTLLQRSEEDIGIVKRDCRNTLQHLQTKTSKVDYGSLVKLFNHAFFKGMVEVKTTANGVIVMVSAPPYLTTSTHRPHDQAAGYDLHFIRDINRVLALFGVRGI
jgi:TPR repeat protein